MSYQHVRSITQSQSWLCTHRPVPGLVASGHVEPLLLAEGSQHVDDQLLVGAQPLEGGVQQRYAVLATVAGTRLGPHGRIWALWGKICRGRRYQNANSILNFFLTGYLLTGLYSSFSSGDLLLLFRDLLPSFLPLLSSLLLLLLPLLRLLSLLGFLLLFRLFLRLPLSSSSSSE